MTNDYIIITWRGWSQGSLLARHNPDWSDRCGPGSGQDSGVSIDEHNDNDINLVTMAPW